MGKVCKSKNKGKHCKKPQKSPSVLTSDKWLHIAEEKEKEKEKQEELKKIRREKREENKVKRENSKQVQQEKKQRNNENRKDESNETSESTKQPMTSEEIKPGNYVIVLYEEKHYPGKVVKTIQPANEFVVSTMKKSGLRDWKWPEEKDEITYSRDEVICKIEEPKKKTKRGTFTVPEMADFEE